jgi:hypothetical protein
MRHACPKVDAARMLGAGNLTTKADWSRERAADCAKLAAAAMDCKAKAMLMHMADAWLRLAEWQEKMAERGSSKEE